MWVDRPEQLLQAVDMLSQARIVAIDAEFAQVRSHSKNDGQTSSQQLALLQLAIEGHCFVGTILRHWLR